MTLATDQNLAFDSTPARGAPRLLAALLAGALLAIAPACSDPTNPIVDGGGGDAVKPLDGGPEGGTPDANNKLTPGIIGQYSALAAVKGTLVMSAYERQYGDLIYVTAGASNLTKMNREIVDGVPKAAATYDPKGWRAGISDAGDDVGLYTDITAGTDGAPRISYHDATNKALKFAIRQADGWKTHVVDKAKGTHDVVGLFTSMTLQTSGAPAIAYLVTGVSAASGNFKSELRYAEAKKPAPTTAGDWVIATVESAAMPCRNLCATGEACVINANKTSTCKKTSTGCSSCASGKACVGGKCVDVLENSKLIDIPKATGLWPALVMVSTGPLVVYHDSINSNLRAALRSGGKWTAALIKGTSKDNVGAYCSAAVDKSGTVHASYQDFNKGTLHYLQLTPPTLKATVSEAIDDGKRATGQHLVGADSQIHVDTAGTVRVVYQDQQLVDLLGVRRAGSNNWLPKTATAKDLGRTVKGGPRGYGFYPDLVAEGGQVYGSCLFYDPKITPEGGLEMFKVQ